MHYAQDNRIIMSLDAGGTNFVFTAMQGYQEIIDPVVLPSNGHDLDLCLKTIKHGFTLIRNNIGEDPVAISFAFPGPADYPNGIIGNLNNLSAFTDGVALGPMLEREFGLPVFINNDGDLFAYGEAIAGFLPYVNQLLEDAGNPKRYKNLLGVTLGTGFGSGIVRDNRLFLGDNSNDGEIWALRNKIEPEMAAEEWASIRGIQRVYAQQSGIPLEQVPEPREIHHIAKGQQQGNQKAAREAFRQLGEVVGDALANCLTMLDVLVVIGGGLTGADDLFLPEIIREMNSTFRMPDGTETRRLDIIAYNLENDEDCQDFTRQTYKEITIPGSSDTVQHDPEKRTAVGLSRLGTTRAVSIGAYTFALQSLDS